ncbi:MAG: replication-relaxation family protein [Actinomycetota bacterium]
MSNDIPPTLGVLRYLSDRDRAILVALLEHKVLLTRQIKTLFFGSQRRCQACLLDLAKQGLIRCFTPRGWYSKGKPPCHWTLRERGVLVTAAIKRTSLWELSWKPASEDARLAHRLAVNAFFCALVEASLDNDGHGLHSWTPERMVKLPDGWIRPDGSGRYLYPGGACDFYFELDRGTETVNQLADKLAGYIAVAKNWTEQGPVGFPNLLILVPDFSRERAVAKALSEARGRFKASRRLSDLPFYVSSEDLLYERGILAPVWARLPGLKERLSISELPAQTGIDYSLSDCLGRRWADKANARRRLPLPRYSAGRPPMGDPGSLRPRSVTPPRYERGSGKQTRDEEQ